jgi:hypothetical protein
MTDEKLTLTVPKLGLGGTGWLTQLGLRLLGLSNMTVNYFFTKVAADNKSTAWIIGEMVRERVAAVI